MLRRTLQASLVLGLLIPAMASAKIWPDDFLPSGDFPLLERMITAPVTETEREPAMVPNEETFQLPQQDMPASPTPIVMGMTTRIDFVAALVSRSAMQSTLDTCFDLLGAGEFSLLFRDVPVTHPYAKHLCVAMKRGLVRGLGDGSFRPDGGMNAAEASVILARMGGLQYEWPTRYETWYAPILKRVRMSVEGVPAMGWTVLNEATTKAILCSLSEGLELITAEPVLCGE